MTTIGQREERTQARVVRLFRETLGYDYLGHWKDQIGKSNIEPDLLRNWLVKQNISNDLIKRAIHEFQRVAGNTTNRLYDRNAEVYDLLRYGVKISPGVGQNNVTVWLIDWKNPENNHFGIAECPHRPIPISHSRRSRSGFPTDLDHAFRLIPISGSSRSRSVCGECGEE